MSREPVIDTMTGPSRVVHHIIRVLVALLARILLRVEFRNRERLPIAGPYIIAPVHRSNLDAFVAVSAVPSRVIVRTVAKDSLWRSERFGWFLEKMGSVPVDRDHPDRAALRRCEEALAHGEPLLMFPEGRRKDGTVVEDLLEGPAWLALRRKVPIVPVGISGTDRAMPKGAKFIRPTKVVVEIGEPIIPVLPDSGRVRQSAVAELTEELRLELQRQYDLARGVTR